jgi:Na+:H+ antiporter, NhaA family
MKRQSIGGYLLLGAIAAALMLANSPLDGLYRGFADNSGLRTIALALFFLNVGLELRHEVRDGILRKPRLAVVPIFAAVTGMIVPAGIFLLFNIGRATSEGWPTVISFDVAFALAVLSIAGRWLPRQLRAFVLSIAVVDDSLAIVVLALVFAGSFNPTALVSLAALAVGLLVPGLHRLRPALDPAVNLVALPLFGFLSAGVAFGSIAGSLDGYLMISIAVAILVGKPLGILGGTFIATKSKLGSLDAAITWPLLRRVAPIFAMCFTVSILMSQLAFANDEALHASANLAVVIVACAMALVSSLYLWRGKKLHG